jgi:hypothetical protein
MCGEKIIWNLNLNDSLKIMLQRWTHTSLFPFLVAQGKCSIFLRSRARNLSMKLGKCSVKLCRYCANFNTNNMLSKVSNKDISCILTPKNTLFPAMISFICLYFQRRNSNIEIFITRNSILWSFFFIFRKISL